MAQTSAFSINDKGTIGFNTGNKKAGNAYHNLHCWLEIFTEETMTEFRRWIKDPDTIAMLKAKLAERDKVEGEAMAKGLKGKEAAAFVSAYYDAKKNGRSTASNGKAVGRADAVDDLLAMI